MTCVGLCLGQPFLCLIPGAFVCQLGGNHLDSKARENKVLMEQRLKEIHGPQQLSWCQPKLQAGTAAQGSVGPLEKAPRSNSRNDPVPLDSEMPERQLVLLGEPWCLQPGVVRRQTTTRVTKENQNQILETGKEASTVWQV